MGLGGWIWMLFCGLTYFFPISTFAVCNGCRDIFSICTAFFFVSFFLSFIFSLDFLSDVFLMAISNRSSRSLCSFSFPTLTSWVDGLELYFCAVG